MAKLSGTPMGVYADGGLGIPNFLDFWVFFGTGFLDFGPVLGPDSDSSGFFGSGGPIFSPNGF